MKPSVLIAAGCSWVAAKAIDVDPAATTLNFDHVEDPTVVETLSFAGLLRQQLGLDQLVLLAAHGSNNERQLQGLVDFIESNKNNYSKVYVIWGLTSIYRWDLYIDSIGKVENCTMTGYMRHPDLKDTVKHYFSNHWNKDYELKKLGKNITLLNGYLNNLSIDHLFFNSFQSYNAKDLFSNIESKYFYRVEEQNNDMLSLLCSVNNIPAPNNSVPWLNLLGAYSHNSVKQLQQIGQLDRATAHPTAAAHATIAEELHRYIKEQQ